MIFNFLKLQGKTPHALEGVGIHAIQKVLSNHLTLLPIRTDQASPVSKTVMPLGLGVI